MYKTALIFAWTGLVPIKRALVSKPAIHIYVDGETKHGACEGTKDRD